MKTYDRTLIRSLLDQDPVWSAYAIADLDDTLFPDCDWYVDGHSLALVYRGLERIRPLFLIGSPAAVLPEVDEPEVYLNLLPAMRPEAERFYTTTDLHDMHRMALGDLRPAEGPVETLNPAHEPALRDFYQLGGGIAFAGWQLASGYFRGVFDQGRLVSVAGVQVASRELGVAAVGNILTHPGYRGRGLAARCLSAVVSALLSSGISTIVLNVEASNASAVRLYERLGFRIHCTYLEGPARLIR